MKKSMVLVSVLLCALCSVARGDADTQPSRPYRIVRIDCGAPYRSAAGRIDISKVAAHADQGVHIEPRWDESPATMAITLIGEGRAYPPELAKSLLDAAVRDLDDQLSEAARNQRVAWQTQLDLETANQVKLERQLDEAESQLQRISARTSEILSDSKLAAGVADTSLDGVRKLADSLGDEYQKTELDLESKTARRAALSETLAQLEAQVHAKMEVDPVAAELQKVADVRQKELDQVKMAQQAAAVSQDDVMKAQAALAEAKAAVLERQEAVAASNGGDTLTAWNHDLLSLSIDLAELRARSDALKDRLKVLKSLIDFLQSSPNVDSLQKKFSDDREQLEDSGVSVGLLSSYLQDKNLPKLTVIESHD